MNNKRPQSKRRASVGQERLYFADTLGSRGSEYNILSAFVVEGPLDVAAFGATCDDLFQRHAALRTSFVLERDAMYQVVDAYHPGNLILRDVGPRAGENGRPSDVDLAQLVNPELHRLFDLSSGPMLRLLLYRFAPDLHVFSVAAHHICLDGVSIGLLLDDLAGLYSAHRHDDSSLSSPAPTLSYADYSDWQRQQFASGAIDGARDYWVDQLAGASDLLPLPGDRPRPAVQDFVGGGILRTESIRQPVEALARAERASDFSVLTAALGLELARLCRTDDLIVGTAVSNRDHPDSHDVVGFFINLLPLRIAIDERMTFRALVGQVRDSLVDALDNRRIPFEDIVQAIQPQRSAAHNSLIQVALTLEPPVRLEVEGCSCRELPIERDIARYDIAVDYYVENETDIKIDVTYSTALFDRSTVERFVDRYLATLQQLVDSPDVPLALLDRTGTQPVMIAPIDSDERTDSRLLDRFDELVSVRPLSVAVSDENDTYTYRDLDLRSDALVKSLKAAGASAESVIAVLLPRGVDLVVAFIASWKLGLPFVPLDPGNPAFRVRHILRESKADLIVSNAAMPNYGGRRKIVDIEDIEAQTPMPGHDLSPVGRGRVSYIMPTSGSTGIPKCVQVGEDSIRNLLAGLRDAGIAVGQRRRVGWNAAAWFDASVQQWTRIFEGDEIYIFSDRQRLDPRVFAACLVDLAIDEVDVTPTHLSLIIDEIDSSWRGDILCGGEALPATLWNRLRARASDDRGRSYNLYGPTECTVDSTCAEVANSERSTLGSTIVNVGAYVLDPWLRPVPDGSVGELYLTGQGLAHGYANRPGATASVFIPDIFRGNGTRMYRTGDLAVARGRRLDYVGRSDSQVKVLGHRIELGEIESAFRSIGGVNNVAIATSMDADEDPYLVAYVVAQGLSTAELRTQVAEILPPYMIPTEIAVVEDIPMTTSGKLDQKAVKASGYEVETEHAKDEIGPVGVMIAQIWARVLDLDCPLDTRSNFFALGGQSLATLQVIAAIRKELRIEITTPTVFANPQLGQLAGVVEERVREAMK